MSRNHSNWPSLNVSENVREGWTNSYWKHQVLMFYPLGKNWEKPYTAGGGGAVRGRVKWSSKETSTDYCWKISSPKRKLDATTLLLRGTYMFRALLLFVRFYEMLVPPPKWSPPSKWSPPPKWPPITTEMIPAVTTEMIPGISGVELKELCHEIQQN